MGAAYDTYDYPSYWLKREYEHKSEGLAFKTILSKIPRINSILEIGAGFGRLVPFYAFRAKKITLSDPSAKLLFLAQKKLKAYPKIEFIQSSLENLKPKIGRKSFDLIIMVRVLHHLKDIDQAFKIIARLVKPKGFFILEYPNKSHLKAVLSEFFRGNLTFLLDIFPKELGRRKKALPFRNYHPDAIEQKLKSAGFKIVDKLSVSNIRSSYFKKLFNLETLLWVEKNLQKPLSYLNFGPSIFILAQKT